MFQLNSFRSIVNILIGSKSSSESVLKFPDRLKHLQKSSRVSILSLMSEKRNLKENPQHFNREFRWKQIREENLKALRKEDKKMYESRKKDQTFFMPLRAVDFVKVKQNRF